MNRKQLIIVLVLVAVVGGIGLSLYKKSSSSYQGGGERSGQKLLGDFDVNEVKQIVIKSDSHELTLANDGKGWAVKERNNYPANFEQIAELIQKAADLKVIQTLPVGPSQLAKLELAEPGKPKSGTSVQFKGANGQVIKSFQLGVNHMKEMKGETQFGGGSYPDGRYVLADPKSGNVAVVNDALSQANSDAVSWLNKDFFKIEKPSSITLDFPEQANSWSLWRKAEADSWKLTNTQPGDNLDTNKVSGFSSALNYPSFNDVLVGKKPEESGLDKPTVLKIETFEKFKYTINIGKPTPEDTYPATISVSAEIPKQREEVKDEKKEDKEKADKEFKEKTGKLQEKLDSEKKLEGWVYLIPKWTFESILKKRSELMVEKKDEKKDDKPTAKEGVEDLKDAKLP